MSIAELIALAKVRSGKSQKEMAEEMGLTNPNVISKIAGGIREANASEIVFLAMAARMDPIEVLAEVETEKHPELKQVWERVRENMHSL